MFEETSATEDIGVVFWQGSCIVETEGGARTRWRDDAHLYPGNDDRVFCPSSGIGAHVYFDIPFFVGKTSLRRRREREALCEGEGCAVENSGIVGNPGTDAVNFLMQRILDNEIHVEFLSSRENGCFSCEGIMRGKEGAGIFAFAVWTEQKGRSTLLCR